MQAMQKARRRSISSERSARSSGRDADADFKFAVGARVKHSIRGVGTVTEHMEDGRTRIVFDSGEEHRYAERSLHKVELYVEEAGVAAIQRQQTVKRIAEAAWRAHATTPPQPRGVRGEGSAGESGGADRGPVGLQHSLICTCTLHVPSCSGPYRTMCLYG